MRAHQAANAVDFLFSTISIVFSVRNEKKKNSHKTTKWKINMTQRRSAAATHNRWPEIDPEHKYSESIGIVCVRGAFFTLNRAANATIQLDSTEIIAGKQNRFMVNDLFLSEIIISLQLQYMRRQKARTRSGA